MITNKGKGLIARSLAGQMASPFSYIAMGVGPQPTVVQAEPASFKNKTSLDFEAFRVPVSGASLVYEGGLTKVALTATLPSAQRYEFSEVGIYSSEFNSLLTTEAPRMLYTFSSNEGWKYHTGTSVTDIAYVGSVTTNAFDIDAVPGSALAVFLSADDSLFFTPNRKNQNVRVYQDSLLVAGSLSTIAIDVTPPIDAEWALGGDHLHVTSIPINLSKAREDDEIKIAFAVLNKTYSEIATHPADEVRIVVVFKDSDDSSMYAKMQVQVTDAVTGVANQVPEDTDFENNGYYVVKTPIRDLVTSPTFSWENVTVAQIHVEVTPAATKTADDYYVAIDAIRFDSNNDNNPAYGLAAYSVVQNASASTELKNAQTESQLEYKIVLEVE